MSKDFRNLSKKEKKKLKNIFSWSCEYSTYGTVCLFYGFVGCLLWIRAFLDVGGHAWETGRELGKLRPCFALMDRQPGPDLYILFPFACNAPTLQWGNERTN